RLGALGAGGIEAADRHLPMIDREVEVLGRQARNRVSLSIEDLNVGDYEINVDVLAEPLVHGATRFVRSLCHRERHGESEHRPDESRIHGTPQDFPRSYARRGFPGTGWIRNARRCPRSLVIFQSVETHRHLADERRTAWQSLWSSKRTTRSRTSRCGESSISPVSETWSSS